jgi:hypothetical protein
MERSRTQHDHTELTDVTVDPCGMKGASTLVTPTETRPRMSVQSVSAEDDVTCEAIHLALSALHIDIAWHAGLMSAEAAMEGLHGEIGKSIKWCNGSTRTGSLEQADGHQSRRTPMRHSTSCS